MCASMVWELVTDRATLREFEDMVRKDFVGIDLYPTYILWCNSLPASLRYQAIALE